MISKKSNFVQPSNIDTKNERIEYLRSVLEDYIGEDSTGNIFIAIYEGHIRTHDEFFVALKYYGKLTPTSKIDKKFNIFYIGTTIFPEYIFEELKFGIISTKNTVKSKEKIAKTQSKWRRLWLKIFGR